LFGKVGKLLPLIPSVGVSYHDWYHTKIHFAGKIAKLIMVCHKWWQDMPTYGKIEQRFANYTNHWQMCQVLANCGIHFDNNHQ
jgi:hypothetical protein